MGKLINMSPYVYPGVCINHIDIMQRVCKVYSNVTPEMLTIQTKLRKVVEPRQVSMYLMKKELKFTLMAIQNIFGFSSHRTVLHGIRTIENLLESDKEFKRKIQSLI